MMLSLPTPRTRGAIRAFWIAFSLVSGATAGVIAAVWMPGRWWLSVPVAIFIAVPGVAWPSKVELAYRAWDKLARVYARGADRYLARICLATVMAVASDRSDRLQRSRPPPGGSGWLERPTQDASTYRHQDTIRRGRNVPQGWWTTVRAWAAHGDNKWALSLAPFLWLSRLLDAGEAPDTTPSDGTYTLY